MADQPKSESIATRFEYWFAVYAVYLFLAGWTYLDYYFGMFGASVSWFDFGLNDTLAHGFTVLFGTGSWLSIVYLVVLLVSLCVEIFVKNNSRLVSTIATLVLVIIFIPTYFIAKHAGIDQANVDRSSKTKLPTITFTDKGCTYQGDLLYAKGGLLYVHNLVSVTAPVLKCPIEVGQITGKIPQLWLVRLDDLQDERIVRYKQEAAP